MKFETIHCSVVDRVATVTLNRPEQLNAIIPKMLEELNEAFAALAVDDAAGIVVLTGAGKAFSAGVDLKVINEHGIKDGAVGDILDIPANSLTDKMSRMPKAVIAKVNGFCFTGALELVLGCDLIVVAAEAKLGDTHTRWGIRPSWGMSQRLPRRVGLLKARELSLTARQFSGREALTIGLANYAPERKDLDTVVDRLCRQILTNSPQAIAAYKDLYRVAENSTLQEGLAYEAAAVYRIDDTMDRLKEFL